MAQISLTEAAAADLDAVDDFTRERFGIGQARRIKKRFKEALTTLAAQPLSAPLREDLSPPGRSFRYRVVASAFMIVYEPMEGGVRVARVLHSARDIAAVLGRDTEAN